MNLYFIVFFIFSSPYKLPTTRTPDSILINRMTTRMSLAKRVKVNVISGIPHLKHISKARGFWFSDEGNLYFGIKYNNKYYTKSLFYNEFAFKIQDTFFSKYSTFLILPNTQILLRKTRDTLYLYSPNATLIKKLIIPILQLNNFYSIYSLENGDLLFISSQRLVRYNPQTNKILWTFFNSQLSIYTHSYYEVANYIMLFDKYHSKLYAVSWDTGKLLWITKIPRIDQKVISYGILLFKPYVVTNNHLYIFSPKNGKLIKTYTFKETVVNIASLESRNAIYMLLKNKFGNYVTTLFDCGTGKFKWGIELPASLIDTRFFTTQSMNLTFVYANRLIGISPDGMIDWVFEIPQSSIPKTFITKNINHHRNSNQLYRNRLKLKNNSSITIISKFFGKNLLVLTEKKMYFLYP